MCRKIYCLFAVVAVLLCMAFGVQATEVPDFADGASDYQLTEGFNAQSFKISVGKGLYTYEGILNLIETYLG